MGFFLAVFLGLALFAIVACVSIFNSIVRKKNAYKNGWSQIDVQMKRRHDLIPSLVETVKGYMSHERETLEAIVKARTNASEKLKEAESNVGSASAMGGLAGAENMLGAAMGRVNLLVENYPDLKSNENFIKLQEEIASTENRISFARQAYNDSVMAFNAYRQTFPAVIIASMTGHTEDAALLEFADAAEIVVAPKVSF